MSRVLIAPQVVGEVRVENIDFTPDMVAGQVAGVPTVSTVVYSGVDPAPPVFTVTNSVNPYIANVTQTGGVLGVIYQVKIRMPTTVPIAVLVKTYYLAIIPDAP